MSASHSRLKRRRFTPAVLAAGVLGTLLLSLSMTGTLSAFTAQITNNTNTAASGSLIMKETSSDGVKECLSTGIGTTVTNNAATCSTINKFGGSNAMLPGTKVTTQINIQNVGTAPASTFTLTPAACTQAKVGTYSGTATDLCAKMNIVIKSGAATVFTGTLAGLAASTPAITMPPAPAAGVSVPFTFDVTLDAAAGDTYQGLQASMPLVWTFST
ncbi:hypothetical protein [Arthrobacter roseus]|uniref:hypothetical protein n=1 Tax=Arthrobacter roseus TaxID=136274 RepID=UPI0019659339|nr:hypothetical protein [Arthrobacter roseus]MBM7848964.1 hypothetical protein [Arthrobacter roseus]